MSLQPYHEKYMARSDEDLRRRAEIKELELQKIFEATKYTTQANPVRVAVTGCADRRHVVAHKQIFEKLLKMKILL